MQTPISSPPSFESLRVWHEARRLAKRIYQVTNEQGFSRDFGLRDQIRRAAVSTMANIAEGFERRGDREFLRFLRIAIGSAGEVRSHSYLAEDVGLLDPAIAWDIGEDAARLSRQMTALIRKITSDLRGQPQQGGVRTTQETG
jgi:four helix bundle protein